MFVYGTLKKRERKSKMLLFVYGTLKKRERNSSFLYNAVFLREVCTRPEFRLLDFGTFPGMTAGHKAIEGELYYVTEDELSRIDDFEGVGWNTEDSVYARHLIQLEDGSQAFAYVCSPFSTPTEFEGTNWYERKCQTVSESLLPDARQ